MEKKNKTTAGLLALFLGGLGIHKFYLGQTLAGVLYLLFSWSCIPAFIAFIEAIIILTMSDDDFNAKYNNSQSSQTSDSGKASDIFLMPSKNNLETLVAYKHLLDEGAITQNEFDQIKSKLI